MLVDGRHAEIGEDPEHFDRIGDAGNRVAAINEPVSAITENAIVTSLEKTPARSWHAKGMNPGRAELSIFHFVGGQNGQGRTETMAGKKIGRGLARMSVVIFVSTFGHAASIAA